MAVNIEQTIMNFENIPISADWAFSEAKRSDTSYITHGYHRYPAKFIPQLARRLIETYSESNDMVLDPFCGCGTTLVESVVAKRYSYGADINPIAIMMTKAKTQHLAPADLERAFHQIQYEIAPLFAASKALPPENERIDYWFKKEQITDLSRLLNTIQNLSDADARLFFLMRIFQYLEKLLNLESEVQQACPRSEQENPGCHADIQSSDSHDDERQCGLSQFDGWTDASSKGRMQRFEMAAAGRGIG